MELLTYFIDKPKRTLENATMSRSALPKKLPNVPAPIAQNTPTIPTSSPPPDLSDAKPTQLRLDLACGSNPKDGYTGVDKINTKATIKLDLLRFPWPWDDQSIEAINCDRFIEYNPKQFIGEADLAQPACTYARCTCHKKSSTCCATCAGELARQFLGQDMFFAFFDECYRILKPNGRMTAMVLHAFNNAAHQDPLARRTIVAETFLYTNALWRHAQKLDYQARCHFDIKCDPTIPATSDLTLLHPEALQRRLRENTNTIAGWQATLTKLEPPVLPTQ